MHFISKTVLLTAFVSTLTVLLVTTDAPSRFCRFTALDQALTFIPFVKARTTGTHNSCAANLKQIDGAKQQWAIENEKAETDLPREADLYGPNLFVKMEPKCPQGGT